MKVNEHLLTWTLVYAIAIWLIHWFASNFVIFDSNKLPLFAGGIILIVTHLAQKLFYGMQIHINKHSLLWFSVHSFTYWLIFTIASYAPTIDNFVFFISFGFLFAIITQTLRHKLFGNFQFTFLKIIIISLLIIGFLHYLAPRLNLGNVPYDEISADVKDFFSELSKTAASASDNLGTSSRDVSSIESEILQGINAERSRNGVRQLSVSLPLHNYARSWSERMLARNSLTHSTLDFSHNSYAGENIAEVPIHYAVVGCGSTYSNEDIAACFVNGWIESQGHHENMINPQFSTTGIGVACDSSECKATQVFEG